MHNLKAILAVLGITLLPSCLLTDFDNLENEAVYVDSSDKGPLEVTGFASALIPTGGGEGLSYYIISPVAPTALHVNFDQQGERKAAAATLINDSFPGVTRLVDAPTVASDSSSFTDPSRSRVALGVNDNGDAKVVFLTGNFGDGNGGVVAPTISVEGGQEPTGIAFGNTGIAPTGAVDGVDMAVIAGAQLNLITDYGETDATPGNCGLLQGGEVLLANLDANAADDEIVIATDGAVYVATGAELAGQLQTPAVSCEVGTTLNTQITVPDGISGFGTVIASGLFNAGDQIDLVFAAPESNAVFVYFDWTIAAPTEAVRVPNPPGTTAFGSALAVGDFNGDGQDELVVGDPKATIAAHPSAGKAFIFNANASGGFDAPVVLHDARAEDEQNFGRSLAAAPAFGSDRLIVGTKDEVFTYFRTPLSGDVDFRQ